MIPVPRPRLSVCLDLTLIVRIDDIAEVATAGALRGGYRCHSSGGCGVLRKVGRVQDDGLCFYCSQDRRRRCRSSGGWPRVIWQCRIDLRLGAETVGAGHFNNSTSG